MMDVGLIFLGCSFALGTAALVVLQWRLAPQHRAREIWPYTVRRPLDYAALVVHEALVNALPGHVILANVPLTQLVAVDGARRGNADRRASSERPFWDLGFRDRSPWERRLDGLVAQFVVCSSRGDVLGAVELLGSGVVTEREHERRREKERVLEAAGVRVLRLRPNRLPDAERLREIFPVAATQAGDPAGPRRRPRWLRVVK